MNDTEPLIRDISDTARWAAVYRARETERPGAVFLDPFARKLAGERGQRIADEMPYSSAHEWSWTARTYLFDQFITEQLEQGVDLVVNLAAGLDARPFRMQLPTGLRWVEVDLPQILDYKEQVLGDERPVCKLERVRLDLSDIVGRRALFERLGNEANKALVITEGLIIYLTTEEVASLAEDLAAARGFQRWVLDLASPGLLRMLRDNMGKPLAEHGSPLKFGPPEGPGFFAPYGWQRRDVRSLLKTAGRLGLLPFWLKMISWLPASNARQGNRPWAGICLMGK